MHVRHRPASATSPAGGRFTSARDLLYCTIIPIDAPRASHHISHTETPMTAPRLPTDLQPPRMDALARLPVFLALEGRRAVVAGGWAEAARRWRGVLFATGLSHPGRRRFWQIFSRYAAIHPDHEPTRSDFDAFLAKTTDEGARSDKGSVTLVGAGPGDPELLTLRAVRALQSADIILVDDLVAPEILDFARREAKKMLVGKTGHGPSCRQEEINSLMVTLATTGKRVVRLKGGDPMIFGRASEEIDACRAAGIAVEVVPGISAAQGAASRLGISLTHRKVSRRVQFVTGHAADGRLPADIDWQSLADPTATTIVYMPSKTIRELADTAIAHGLAPDTPTIAVASATRPEQEVIAGTIADIADRLRDAA